MKAKAEGMSSFHGVGVRVGGSGCAPVWQSASAAATYGAFQVPGTSTSTEWHLIAMTALEAGGAHANFLSLKAGVQRGQGVFPQSSTSGRAAVSNDKVCALDP